MKKKFQADDHQYIRKLARDDSSRSAEKQKKRDMIEHTQAKIDKQKEAFEKKRKTAAETACRVASVELILEKDQIVNLKSQALKDHLKAFQKAGAPNIQNLNARTAVALIRDGLKQAIDLYNSGVWKPAITSQPGILPDQSNSGEEFNLDEDTGEWEDI